MYTTTPVKIGPGTVARLREIAVKEGIEPDDVLAQAVAVWSQLDGEEERRRAGFALMAIVFDRVRPSRPKAA